MQLQNRECGDCSMCCKLMEITELEKPAGRWCQHVVKKKGCRIYDDRPASCAAFMCGYLVWPLAEEYWRPSKSKMVTVMEDENRMAIYVDPSMPNIWKSEPYYEDILSWGYQAYKSNQQLVVSVNRHMFAILPDGPFDLGFVAENQVVVTGQSSDGSFIAEKVEADDPWIAGFEYGKPFMADAKKLGL